VIDWIRGQGFGLSTLISLGNQADVNETDVLAPVAADPNTRVITMYMEGVSDGQRFVEQARQVCRQKPVVALKVGRFESGKRAAASHTGALAGQESAFDAAFQKAGVIRANTTLEMFQWARALAWSPLPAGRNVAVLTNAGGPGVTAADALELHGLKLASLHESTRTGLKALLPAAASLHNPVDMLASASPEQYAESLRLLLADPGVDSVLIIAPPPPTSSAGAVAKAIIPVVQMTEKPVVVTLMGDRLIQEGVEFLRAARILEFRFPEESASALGVLSQRVDGLKRLTEEPVAFTDIDRKKAAWLLASQPTGQFVDQETINGLLDIYDLPILKEELADSPEKAVEIADLMGYPVVLKVASPDISHKSDVGGVLLNLRSPEAVKEGYRTVVQKARLARPGANIEGVHIQRMLPYGQEVIVGVVQDPQFGPLVMFGSGGVEVEGMKDVAFALAPLSAQDANRLLESTWAGRKLAGFRNLPPADRAGVINVLLRLSQLAHDFPQLTEIEINPLRVLAAGQGAFAVDVRARLAG
jgi:acetyltransferase